MDDTTNRAEPGSQDDLLMTAASVEEAVADSLVADEEEREEETGIEDPGRPSRIAAWLLMVGGLALAGLFVAVPAHTYDLDFGGRVTSDVRNIDFAQLWRIQTRNLPEVRYEAVLQVFFVACGVVVLLGSAAMIWLATVDIRPTDARPAIEPVRRSADHPAAS